VSRVFPSLVVIVLGFMTLWFASDGFRAFTEESARRLRIAEHRPALPPTKLETMDGDLVQFGAANSLNPAFSLIEFIYTTCPTICQSAAADFAVIRDRLVEAGLENRVQMHSVSFDPERDNPAQLRRYGALHGADGDVWKISRIPRRDLDQVKKAFGLRIIPDQWGGYQHNAAIHVVDRSARLVKVFDIDDVSGVLRFVAQKSP
jgi:protein SCO1/2